MTMLTEAEEACHRARIATRKALNAVKACGAYSPDMLKFLFEGEDDLIAAAQIVLDRRQAVLDGTLEQRQAA